MSTAKVAITIDRELLGRLYSLVEKNAFPNQSNAIQKLSRRNSPGWIARGLPASALSSTRT